MDAAGTLARGIEMQLVGLSEPDSSCVAFGLKDANAAARDFADHLGESPGQVEDRDIGSDAHEPRRAVALRLIKGGAGELVSDESAVPTLEEEDEDQ